VKAHGSKIGLRAFEKLKPYYVQKLKEVKGTHVHVNVM
jgi:hypothetical protein